MNNNSSVRKNQMNTPLIIAHRGASKSAYENSVEAFQLAIEQSADMIELDTHLTKDSHFVVHHDYFICVDDNKYEISNTKLAEIKEIRLPNGEQIPLLKDVLDKYLTKIAFNIEVKCEINRVQIDNLLQDYRDLLDKIIISSFNTNNLVKLRGAQYRLGMLYVFPNKTSKRFSKNDFVTAMHPYYKFLTSRRVKKYQNDGKIVNIWTINKPKHIIRSLKLGVDGLITDQPKETREIAEKYLKSRK